MFRAEFSKELQNFSLYFHAISNWFPEEKIGFSKKLPEFSRNFPWNKRFSLEVSQNGREFIKICAENVDKFCKIKKSGRKQVFLGKLFAFPRDFQTSTFCSNFGISSKQFTQVPWRGNGKGRTEQNTHSKQSTQARLVESRFGHWKWVSHEWILLCIQQEYSPSKWRERENGTKWNLEERESEKKYILAIPNHRIELTNCVSVSRVPANNTKLEERERRRMDPSFENAIFGLLSPHLAWTGFCVVRERENERTFPLLLSKYNYLPYYQVPSSWILLPERRKKLATQEVHLPGATNSLELIHFVRFFFFLAAAAVAGGIQLKRFTLLLFPFECICLQEKKGKKW